MGFFDKLKSGLDALNEGAKTAGKYVDKYVDDQISKSSDSRLLDVYNRTESSRLKVILILTKTMIMIIKCS